MNANQLDRAAYQAAHAIMTSSDAGARRSRPIDGIADIIKNVFEPLCDADGAVPGGKNFHVAADSAAQSRTGR